MRLTKKNKTRELEFSEEQLVEDLKHEAKVAKKIKQWITDKPTITQSDLDRQIMAEVKKYNKDLAFILGERNKII